ncbi:hypothetical protein KDK95_03050 [Actinospica sp. MGRD01-02]|uniref:CopG-like ribbon-helix-helix domain-containing protein n=1 Tax=Actinospica acidithermotolerans TaxID=2828514 RepID=A0A941IEI6_9ACTN|nr:hypothetical protein [Actinospica acidithermotolerans]MBR7825270.1 hypothetical protein [Actinospica acidithermotolerans]
METKPEVSVGIPRQLWNRVELAARDERVPVAAMVEEAINQHLSCRARLRTVASWAGEEAGVEFGEPSCS